MDIWADYDLEMDRLYSGQIGACRLWARLVPGDLYLAWTYEPVERLCKPLELLPPDSPEPEGLDWERWAFSGGGCRISLEPVLPEKPVVVRPEVPYHLPQGHHSRIFLSLPLWIRISSGQSLITEIPSVKLNRTWFGDRTQGELCYSLKSRASRDLSMVEPTSYRATCQIHIRNQSKAVLDFNRICLQVEYLSLFRNQERLWTNTVHVQYRGEEQLSQIHFGKEGPANTGSKMKALSGPRVLPTEGLVRKSFTFLKNLTTLDF